MEQLSLAEALAAVPDPRDARGLIHPLPAVLGLTVLAVLAGHTGPEAIAQFGRDHGPALAHALGFRRGKTPAKSTLSEIYRAVDPAALETAINRWLIARTREAGWEAIALDGKTLRGRGDGAAPAAHLLAAYVPAAAAVLAQVRVGAKTNEHKAALQLLGLLPLEGKVVTGDALFTHRDVAEKVHASGGDYLLVVKDNQPELKAHIASALHDAAAFSPLAAQAEGGGRADGPHRGQGARALRGAAADEHDGAKRLPGLAGGRAGVRVGAGAAGGGQDHRGGGPRHYQPDARDSGCGAVVGSGARALGDREPVALRA